MGTKFGNLQVRSEDTEAVIAAFRELPAANDPIPGRYYVGSIAPGWVSILGDDYGWGNVVEEAENVSSLTGSPVLSVGYFDDDVLELTVAVNGETIATHVAGPGLDVYELDAETADAETLIRSLQLTVGAAKLREILADPSIEDTVMRLQEAINVPLWFMYDAVEYEKQLSASLEHIVKGASEQPEENEDGRGIIDRFVSRHTLERK